jgi:hypothetical protein
MRRFSRDSRFRAFAISVFTHSLEGSCDNA